MSRILCRLCALQNEKFVDIYESDDSNTELDTKIASCLQIRVSKEDVLPKTVCMKCCIKLNEFFYFLQKSKKAQLLLQEIYETKKKNIEKKNNDCEVEIPNNIQCELQDSNDDGDSEIEEDFLSRPENEPCSQLDLTDESLRDENLESQNTKLSTTAGSNDKECDEVMNLIGVIEKKSRRRKQDQSLNDVPANPRLTHLLQEYSWPCTMCEDRIMNSLKDLKDHYKSEHQHPPVFKCITCEKQYDRYRSFTRHIKMHSNPKRYSCDTCGKSFAQRSVLQSHAMVHSSEKPHVCQTCGKSFKNSSSLYVHGKRHLPDQVKEKYCCDSCEKQFSTRHTLETHKKIHTGERNFVCDICGKSFVAKSSLDYHLLTHTGEKNHVCSTCGKAFKTARLLGKHISLHTGIKPHQCDVCGKQFRERGALREHSRIHTGAMPYSCEFCGKCFRFKGILTVHRRQHTGERPYACLECRRHFTNWANYNKHMKRIHHCDTSNRENSRQRSSADNVQANVTSNENNKSVVLTPEEKKMNLYSISSRNTSQKRESSTELSLDTDHN